jgi:hypothetical protein
MASQVQVVGVSNNPPYNNDVLPVNVINAGNNTYSLSVTPTIPMTGQVSNYINMVEGSGINPINSPYTVPGNATLYIVNLSASANATATCYIEVTDASNNVIQYIPLYLSSTSNINLSGTIPILIAQQGQTVTIGISTGGDAGVNASGYLLYGQTT